MKLTIVAATGGIGRLMLEQAVAAGHDVTAVVRNPAKVTAGVRVVQADLSRPNPSRSPPRWRGPTRCYPASAGIRGPMRTSQPGGPGRS